MNLRKKFELKEGIGRVDFIAAYLLFHGALYLLVRFLFAIRFEYVLQGILLVNAVTILFVCYISYKRILDINPNWVVLATVPLLSFVYDLKWLAFFKLDSSSFYNYNVAPLLAILGIAFILLLAMVPGRN